LHDIVIYCPHAGASKLDSNRFTEGADAAYRIDDRVVASDPAVTAYAYAKYRVLERLNILDYVSSASVSYAKRDSELESLNDPVPDYDLTAVITGDSSLS
jgi:hypothetical protein